MNENVKKNAKFTARIVGSICASFTVGRIIGTICPNVGAVGNVVMAIGAGCIGGVIGDKCGEYLENSVENVCDLIDIVSKVTVSEC